ncbi:MAG: heavy metal translocating P-type ATPase [Caldilineaceae bacterium]
MIKQRQITSKQGLLALVRRKPLITRLMGVNGHTAAVVPPLPLAAGAVQALNEVRTDVSTRTVALKTHLAHTASALDDAFQKFMRTRFDRLFGRARSQQLEEMSSTAAALQISKYEKNTNRHIALTSTGLAAMLVSSAFYPLAMPIVAVPIFWLSLPIFKKAYQTIRYERQINYYVLGAVSSAGVWLGGFFIPAALGSTVYYLAEKLLVITQDRSYKGLANIFGQQPRAVWVLVDGLEVEVPFTQVRTGDLVIINAGQMVPVDGVIVSGMASIDQHALNGEAQPAEKTVGDSVLAATVVLAGKILVRVDKAGKETVAAQIGSMLNRTASYQMSLQSKGMQIAHKSALPTLLLGALAWPTIGLEQALALLSSSFGVNIRMTSPIAVLNFLNIASKQGILVKDGRSLELLGDVDTVVFDKTGTLTLEQPHVTQLYPCNGLDEATLLAYAAAAEHRQTHPIARAILAAAASRALPVPAIDDAQYEVGYGIKVTIGEQVIRAGSDRFMQLEGIAIPEAIRARQNAAHALGHSLVMVGVGDSLGGAIELEPTIRPEAKAIIDNLHARGIALVIISGDQEGPTRQLAQTLGIERYFANTLPENKAALVKQLQDEGRVVCFVGDGINDAIALKKAQVSVSLRGATTVATDTAQIVLMDQSLKHLPQLFDIADEFAKNLQTGFTSAIVPGMINIGGILIFHWGLYASMLIAYLALFNNLGIAAWPAIKYGDNAIGRRVRAHQRLTDRPLRQRGIARQEKGFLKNANHLTQQFTTAINRLSLPNRSQNVFDAKGGKGKFTTESLQLQRWVAFALSDQSDVQQWVATRSPAVLNRFTAHLACLFGELKQDFSQLEPSQWANDPTFANTVQQMILAHLQAWQYAESTPNAAKALQAYLNFDRAPGHPENWAFGQKFYHQLVEQNLAPTMPTDLAWAGDRARQAFVLQTLRRAATQDVSAFYRVLGS